mmetsp:Transcript_22358/g.44880  ORF Transcript_22358/g.44880 Transcript_22358/m.44880 type:complete len:305 (+) Transcript_22358:79-993(+)
MRNARRRPRNGRVAKPVPPRRRHVQPLLSDNHGDNGSLSAGNGKVTRGHRHGNGKRLDGDSHIFVAVRPRPLTTQELAKGSWACVEVRQNRVSLQDPRDLVSKDPLHRTRATHFELDAVFPPEADQGRVFEATSSRIIRSIINGKNGTIFAYGATGSGKTYTMAGTATNPGLIPTMVSRLLDRLRHDGIPFRIKVSYLEIYNETMRDLLGGREERSIVLREHPTKGVMIMGCRTEFVSTADQVYRFIHQGDQVRATDSHSLNDKSSRSHAIFQMRIIIGNRKTPVKLSLIDLAGSERAKKNENG